MLIKLEYFRQNFEGYSNIKFHENPSSWSRVVPCGQTDMVKLVVTFCNFSKALRNVKRITVCILLIAYKAR